MLKFALLGCGRIAKRHSELLGYKQIKNAELVAVCDVVEEKARKIGEQFGVPHFSNKHVGEKNDMPQVGDNVILGTGSKILGGVRVENDAIIDSLTLVNKNVAKGSTVVGIPGRDIRSD